MIILALETSCDETSAAVLKNDRILSNIVFSQEKIHAKYGGIVPEVAARAHIEVIIPIIEKALCVAKIKKENLDAIAVTYGPGLITSLMVGIDTAKSLAFVLNKPIIPINHLEGHIYANFIQDTRYKILDTNYNLFPLLCLIVSGGHTELVYMPRHLKYKLIGETRDDAAGECFDKVAKLLNIGYPGGPIISRLADLGNSKSYQFPRPMLDSGDSDFSFSGLKTDILRLVKRESGKFSDQEIKNICASFQAAVCDVLISKTIAAARKYKVKTIALAGGVASNKFLREKMEQEIKNQIPNTKYLIPNTQFCTDNAAMIGLAAYYKLKTGIKTSWDKIDIDANAKL